MKKYILAIFSVFTIFILHAQDTTKFRVGIFAPIYLDSAFDGAQQYRYAKNSFPKFINAGLEFYEGAQYALDSLAKENSALEIYVYDTRSAKESLENQLERAATRDQVQLIIAHCSGNEIRLFADAGLQHQIPVINTTIPNDGGITNNPFFVILNPTLRTQIEGIYKFVQKNYATNPVIVFRKKGTTEDQIKLMLDNYGKSTTSVPLKLRYVDLPDSFTVNQLKAQLDSNRHSVCIAGSLDINFGRRLAYQLATINTQYLTVVVGMPTWDAIREFSNPEFKGQEIVYSNPFYNPKTDRVSQGINNYFSTTMYSRPSDMVYRGYEVTWKYAKLLMEFGKDLASNLGNKQYKVFTDFDIQPVINKNTTTLDYFENKKLYFLKWQDGVIKAVY